MKLWRWLAQDKVTCVLFALNLALMAWVAHRYMTKSAAPRIWSPVAQLAAPLVSKSENSAVHPDSTGKSSGNEVVAAPPVIAPPQEIRAARQLEQTKRGMERKLKNYILLSDLNGEDLEQVLDLLVARANSRTAAGRLQLDEILSQKIGESEIALIDYHLHTEILRGQLNQLEAVLAPGPSPLTPHQVEQLIALWCAQSQFPVNGAGAKPRLPDKIDEPSLDAAAKFLDQAQFAAFQRFAAAREAVAAMSAVQSVKARP